MSVTPSCKRLPKRSLLASAIGLSLASTTVLGQRADDEIVVSGRPYDREPESVKFTAPLLDTPKSVTVIPQEFIGELGATSLVDALRIVPGITFNAGEGGQPAGDNLKIRGYDAGADVFIDGLRDAGSQTRDVFALEQIEVVKGPGSAYTGRGSSGGSVNLVTKKPRAEDFLITHLGAGTDGYARATIDLNRSFGDSAAFRLNALTQEGDVPGRNAVSLSHRGLAPSLVFGLDRPTTIGLDFYRYETDDVPDYSIPYRRNAANTAPEGTPVDVDRESFYGVLNRDFQRTGADIRTLRVEHDFANGLTLRNTTRYGKTTNHYIVTNPDDGRGNVPNGFVLRSAKSRNSETTTYANVTDLAGMATTGRLAHSYVIGAEVSQEEMFNVPYVVTGVFASNVNVDFANSCSAPGAVGAASGYNCTTLHDPNPHDPWTGTIVPSTSTTAVETDTWSVYAFDTLELNERWSLNLGLRYDDYRTRQDSFSGGAPLYLENAADFWNSQVGLVFKPARNGSLYLGTGTSSTPSGNTLGDGTENLAASNADLEPERDRSYELGTKWSLLDDRLGVNAAVFRTETSNARANVAPGVQRNIGDERVDGVEVSVTGSVTERWQLYGSVTYLDSEIVDDGPLNAFEGNEFPNTPRESLSLWTTYRVLPWLTIGGGTTYVDKRFANTANTLWVPSYWRYDAVASFDLGDRIDVQINVQNLTDEVYYVRPYQNHYAAIGPARSAVVSANVRF